MLKVMVWVGIVAVGLCACSSDVDGNGSSSGGGACADISGNYSVTGERVSGTCDPSLDPKGPTSVGVQKANDGTWMMVFPSIEGGCPGTLDMATCKFTSACEVRDKTGALIGNSSITYTFTKTGYTGSSVTGLNPPAVTTACNATYRETATKL